MKPELARILLVPLLARLSPGGLKEFVQSVPVGVAGSLMRFAAHSAPLRSYRSVLSLWLVLHVLVTLQCHLGLEELLGTCWAGHLRKNSKVWCMVVRWSLQKRILFFP